ncbi:hypothetical protein ACB092_03G220000 [Castanea dentata]
MRKTMWIHVHFLLAFLFKYSFFIYLNFVFLTFSKHKYTSIHFPAKSQISLYMLTNELHSAFIKTMWGLFILNIMFPVNIVGAPLSRKCSIICVITNSSKVRYYQAVLL